MEWLSFIVFGLLIVVSPGADFVLVFKTSALQGRKAGVLTALGIGLGVCVHVTYSVIGISQLVQHNVWLFNLIKYLGAGYLVYLGVKGLFQSKFHLAVPSKGDLHSNTSKARTAILQGFLCNLLNPKTMLFFLSVFSQLIANQPNGETVYVIVYGVYIALLHSLWFTAVAYWLTSATVSTWMTRFGHRINQLCSAVLISFGVLLTLNR
ncbi:LysE family translocator [Vibrio nitrifigilis]|uniref:LysE family translocator n=1 Tax=Vibrio nitrifigilis TaxID=2789781 RepID=A0ABS0GIR2_9VIBR|nr:LysE family translocator [Vibrio nitrifigilis]MBF9002324.1 LysE family translocator [Vibrio nitrifigilis]